MPDTTIRAFTAADGDAVLDLQVRYAQAFPGAVVVPPQVYTGPGFDEGRNVLCAFAADGALLGYTGVYVDPTQTPPSGTPHVLWSVLKPDAALPDPELVRQALYDALLARLSELRPMLPTDVELRFELQPGEVAAIAFAQAQGFARTNSVYHMVCDLAEPIAPVVAVAGVEVRPWKIATMEERRQYLAARSVCLPANPWSLDALSFLLDSPLWREGAAITAFAGEAVAGSVMAYWDDAGNERSGRRVGFTEEVFVLPEWRGQGLGRYLLSAALHYLQQHGLAEAELQVAVANERALGLYLGLGYRVVSETLHLARRV